MPPRVALAAPLALLAATTLAADPARIPAPTAPTAPTGAPAADSARSADWLALLPDGPEKRQFVLDCTGCHQMGDQHFRPGGRPRSRDEWVEVVTRMLGYGGATTPFPVISADRDAGRTAEWLHRYLADRTPTPAAPPALPAGAPPATIREYPMPVAQDLPHDVAVEHDGTVVVTGMFTGRMFLLDPRTGTVRDVPIPVERANPRAIEIDRRGDWWVVLGAPQQLARYARAEGRWDVFDVGMYPHSVALAPDGSAWVNGHFTRDPELIARVDSTGTVTTVAMPPHPTMAAGPGGPIPYEIRVAPDGTVWMGELQGGRLLAHTPATGETRAYDMPTALDGPRRFDVDARGDLWIPAYAANQLVHLDARTGRFTAYDLPIRDAVPYVAKVDARANAVWIGTAAADAILRFDLATRAFTTHPLPSRGAMVRHLALDPRTGDLWIAYGASPGIAARVARLSTADAAEAPATPSPAGPSPAGPSPAAPPSSAPPSPAPSPSGPSSPPGTLTPAVRAAVVDTVAAQLERFYAVADTGRLIADHLRARLRAGAYDALTHPTAFMDAVSADMKAINGDKHLSLGTRGNGPALPLGATRLPVLPVTGEPPADYPAPLLEMARRSAFDLGRVEVLPGNVGYFRIDGFSQAVGPAREPITAALQYLAHADAIIFDVREHRGGSGYLSNFVVSHFFGPDTVHNLDVEVRAAGQRSSRWTLATVPGPRRPDVPIYVLTSRGTVSAGEDFAFVLKNLERATLVGETTAGAGRNNPTFDAGHGFAASISVSRVKDPRTGAEWEGVGVVPHVAVPPRTALAVAHDLALERLQAEAATEPRRRELARVREYVVAQAAPHPVPAATLERYVGTYGGERVITVEEGKLVFRRHAHYAGIELVPLSDTLFALGPLARLRFEPAADGWAMHAIPLAGAPLVLPRTGPPPAIPSEHR